MMTISSCRRCQNLHNSHSNLHYKLASCSIHNKNKPIHYKPASCSIHNQNKPTFSVLRLSNDQDVSQSDAPLMLVHPQMNICQYQHTQTHARTNHRVTDALPSLIYTQASHTTASLTLSLLKYTQASHTTTSLTLSLLISTQASHTTASLTLSLLNYTQASHTTTSLTLSLLISTQASHTTTSLTLSLLISTFHTSISHHPSTHRCVQHPLPSHPH